MVELTKEYKDKGFFIVSPIFYKKRTFVKCGNHKDNKIYYFEIENNNTKEIKDEEILTWLAKNDNYSFEKIEPEGVFDVAFEVIASVPKLELPKHKVLSIKD